jgi:uncharacterized protein involved in cysteine biosynthesis
MSTMDTPSKRRAPTERNPITTRHHRRETWWQISLPLLVGALIFVALAVGANFGTNEAVGQWARIAMILLAIPVIILALITLVVLVAFIYLIARLTGLIPPYAFLAQEFFARLARMSRQAADKAVEPILRLNAFTAGLGALRRRS